MNNVDFEVLAGKQLQGIALFDDEVIFYFTGAEEYKLYHSQDCCEYVYLEDVVGNVFDLLHGPIVLAEEVSSDRPALDNSDESHTWTFYKLATNRGSVTLRFYGTSNGYYSEEVDFIRIK